MVKRTRTETRDATRADVITSTLDIQEEKEEEKEEEDVIPYEALGNILSDFVVKEFMHAKTPLCITHQMRAHYQELEATIEHDQGHTRLLQGPSSAGKTTTLLYIGHMARAKGYVVFPLQAHDFVNQPKPMSLLIKEFLRRWVGAVGEDILKDIFPEDLYRVKRSICSPYTDEKYIIQVFRTLVTELQTCKDKTVIFLIDQCNAFNVDRQTLQMYPDGDFEVVGPEKNPVGAMFLEWNTFQVRRGGIFFGFTSAFQFRLMPDAHDGNVSLVSRMEPMPAEDFHRFIAFRIRQDRLPVYCESTHFQDFLKLCGGIPREACAFGEVLFRANSKINQDATIYPQWKDAYMNARIPFFKARIQMLLDEHKLGTGPWKERISFASSLFVGEKTVSAPRDWTASGFIVTTKDGFQKLLCPAAEEAFLSVFNEDQVLYKALDFFRKAPTIRWRRWELAVVSLFRRSHGRPINVGCTDLHGKNKRSLMITAGLIEHGGTIPPLPNSIRRNTVFVGTRNTPVVDFFIHDANGAQILIQVSESSYQDHQAKYHPESQNVKAYAAAALNPTPGVKLQYIYLTRNINALDQVYYRADVWLVADDNMKRLLGDLRVFDFHSDNPYSIR